MHAANNVIHWYYIVCISVLTLLQLASPSIQRLSFKSISNSLFVLFPWDFIFCLGGQCIISFTVVMTPGGMMQTTCWVYIVSVMKPRGLRDLDTHRNLYKHLCVKCKGVPSVSLYKVFILQPIKSFLSLATKPLCNFPGKCVVLTLSWTVTTFGSHWNCRQTLYELVKFEITAVKPSTFFTTVYIFKLQPFSYNC